MDDNLRPYEKCERSGPGALTDAELIAVIIKSGCCGKSAVELAGELLEISCPDGAESIKDENGEYIRHYSLPRLMAVTRDELKRHKGIGRVKSLQLICLAELARRIAREHAVKGLSVSSPKSVAAYYMEDLRYKSEEEVHLMLLDIKGNLLSSVLLSRGTVNSAAFSPREVFIAALRFKAAGMILVHNHPSGDPRPSSDDLEISRNLLKLGEMMNIRLKDSIIIGDNSYISLLEEGLF